EHARHGRVPVAVPDECLGLSIRESVGLENRFRIPSARLSIRYQAKTADRFAIMDRVIADDETHIHLQAFQRNLRGNRTGRNRVSKPPSVCPQNYIPTVPQPGRHVILLAVIGPLSDVLGTEEPQSSPGGPVPEVR